MGFKFAGKTSSTCILATLVSLYYNHNFKHNTHTTYKYRTLLLHTKQPSYVLEVTKPKGKEIFLTADMSFFKFYRNIIPFKLRIICCCISTFDIFVLNYACIKLTPLFCESTKFFLLIVVCVYIDLNIFECHNILTTFHQNRPFLIEWEVRKAQTCKT